jgi:CRISPR-associated endonuclease Csn1
MKKLGLDAGSSSLGWFLRNGKDIIKYGTIIFDSGMIKGTSGYSSPTKDRREARLKRNPIKARKYRKTLILKTLIENEMVPLEILELQLWSDYKKGRKNKFPSNDNFKDWLACDFRFSKGENYKNPYELRVKALDTKLAKMDLGRVLYHLVQRRGFKDIGEKNDETIKQKKRREESGFQEALNNSRSIAEALQKEYLEKDKRARDNYPYRDEYEEELLKILAKQGLSLEKDEDKKYKDEFVRNIHKAIIWQQPLKTQKGTIGKCTLEPSKRRCAYSHPLFEVFRALQFINTIKFKKEKDDDFLAISQEYRDKLLLSLFLKESGNFKFEKIRKFLDKQFKQKMIYNYRFDSKKQTYESTVSGMPFCKVAIKYFGDIAKKDILEVENYKQDSMPKNYGNYSLLDIWHNVTEFDNEKLTELGLKMKLDLVERKRNGKIEYVSPLIIIQESLPQGYASLSQYVIRKIIPLLKKGYLYNDAVLLANLKDSLGENFEVHKNSVNEILKKANKEYLANKLIITITNKLIEKFKGEEEANLNGLESERFAHNDFEFQLRSSDKIDIINACISYFGESKWLNYDNKDFLIENVSKQYQEFFFDTERKFRNITKLQELFENYLDENNIILNKPLYHHSKQENIYGKTIKFKDTDIDILPLAKSNSIKNPMFNKAMGVIRKLVNQLIVDGDIDKETDIIIEVAKELNDNNKRIAIEKFQKQREAKRNKIRQFLEEYKSQEKQSLNVEESIVQFELWDEQIFQNTEDENGQTQKNTDRKDILKLNKSINRYELWMEQKGQCIYSGKMISISQLFSSTTNIEHTIPRDILPDNTMANKTIAFRYYNTSIKKTEFPANLPNFNKNTKEGSAIEPRLSKWKEIREGFKIAFESRQKAKGVEDENTKNTRIQDKHFFKMHFDYWSDKLERFEKTDVNDKWARRQLTDTQNISKYARQFLKTYFTRVGVQKGSTTAEYRKMLKLEDNDNPKDRNLHTHHILDAGVLTYIPTNASRRDKFMKLSYKIRENNNKQFHYIPHKNFDAQKIKKEIETNTLIYNYTKDTLTSQTFKKVRKSGKIQHKKDKNGDKILSEPIISRGNTIRASLYKDSFLAKIKDVERYEDGQPKRNKDNSDWKYKTGKDEFIYAKKEPISKITDKNVNQIIDKNLAKLIESQLGNDKILDWQGNEIRHIRIKKKAGKIVKQRLDYRSDKEHKNFYYAESGEIPYGVMLFNSKNDERILLQVHAYQVANIYREKRKFDIEYFVETFYPNFKEHQKLLLKVGQNLLILNDDAEYENRFSKTFQRNRLYKIIKIGDGSLWLKYHLTAKADSDLDLLIKIKKDEILWSYEKQLGLSKILPDEKIDDVKTKNEDFERRKYKLNSYKDFRIKRIIDNFGKNKASDIKSELDKYKKVSSFIEIEGETHLLKLNTSKSWNFLYENEDFEISILGEIRFLK